MALFIKKKTVGKSKYLGTLYTYDLLQPSDKIFLGGKLDLLWYLRLNCFCSFLWKNLKFKFFQSKSVDGTNFWTVKRLKLVAIFRWWYWPKMNLSVVHFVRCTGYWFFKTYTYSLFNSSLGKISTVWTFHTVSFDWFLSGLEWNIKLECCPIKLLILYQKLLWDIKIFIFCYKSVSFDQTYLGTGLKKLKMCKS